jgi:hypothetical protein
VVSGAAYPPDERRRHLPAGSLRLSRAVDAGPRAPSLVCKPMSGPS